MDTVPASKPDLDEIYRRVADKGIDFSEPISPQIYTILRQAIIQNTIGPGTPIYESKFAEALGVSRTPFRAALQQLVNEELVETRPQVGSVVTMIDGKKVFSAIFSRRAIERAIVKRLAGLEMRQMDSLSHLLNRQAECTDRDDYVGFFELDDAFHSRLAEMAGVPEAWRLVVLSKTHVDRARLHLQSAIPGRAAMAYREHLSIIDAIRNGDADRAASLMDSHVGSVMDILGDGHTGKSPIPAPGG